MNNISINLVLVYSVSTALLLALCFSDRFSRFLKIVLVVSVTSLYFVAWYGYQTTLGWPTKEMLPDEFRVIWITVQEPNKIRKTPGMIALWVRRLDESGLAYGRPRAHSIPWSEEAAEAAQKALDNLGEGELLNGRMSRDLAPTTDDLEAEMHDFDSGKSPQDEEGSSPYFEFFKVAPPTLPAKNM
ncbi:MAG: hypothetical protein VX095_03300 [Pseudomonadota bacterium]|nr:hypothetical protein [Pseudomonadota bacterium]